ncbi:MAG TPA: HAD-IA family hydrolase [Bryobacteraceae bacterium]|nr:HAD-IA family hydrolase [Bryobacteraceae bacterium]HPQ15865.1 HAD-IA family hydrolase [Bryobacteraceae bacterium]HPU73964.1 HAD-IA family hydrolase [Bryobacteraceae bacterium]
MLPPFPVYLFDVDGTLLDSAEDICGAILEVLADTPCCSLTTADLKGYVGVHLLDMFRDLLPDYTEEQYDELIRRYRTVYPARKHRATRVYPGVREALAAMPGRKATATTKASETTRAVLSQFGLIDYFDHVQGTDGFPYKPAPDVVFTSLKALGARPEDCLFVGDSPADMEAGRRAGVKICAVRYGYGDPKELARWDPDYWISDLRELL